MDYLFGLLALVGLIAALIVHIAAFAGLDVTVQFPFVWVLHAGVFAVFIPFVLSSRKMLGAKPGFAEIRRSFPLWVVVLGIGVFAYAFVNFFIAMGLSEGGVPGIRGDKYVIESHGRLIRELTEGEYHLHKAYEIRGFSGHWLVFYYFPCAYFLFRKKPDPTLDDGRAKSGAPVN